jgi:hypothetical protein
MTTALHTLRFLARCDRKVLNKLCFRSTSCRDNNFDGVRIVVLLVSARLVLVPCRRARRTPSKLSLR